MIIKYYYELAYVCMQSYLVKSWWNMDSWYTVIDDLGESSCSILNASSFMIKAHRFGTMTYTGFLHFLIKRLLILLSMESGTLNTYRNSSVSLSVYHCHNYALILWLQLPDLFPGSVIAVHCCCPVIYLKNGFRSPLSLHTF